MIDFLDSLFRTLTGYPLTVEAVFVFAFFAVSGYYTASLIRTFSFIRVVLFLITSFIFVIILESIPWIFTFVFVSCFLLNFSRFFFQGSFSFSFFTELFAYASFGIRKVKEHIENKDDEFGEEQARPKQEGRVNEPDIDPWEVPKIYNEQYYEKCLVILGFDPSKPFQGAWVKKASNRMAMEHYPDRPHGDAKKYKAALVSYKYIELHYQEYIDGKEYKL